MSGTPRSGLSENSVAAISYITFIPAIVFLLLPPYHRSAYVRFHSWQSVIFNCTALLVSIVVRFAMVAADLQFTYAAAFCQRLVGLAWLLVLILCTLNALNGRQFRLPAAGALAAKQAGA